MLALYALDHELTRAQRAASQLAAEIRLTWWGEAIAEVFSGQASRRHPLVEALAHLVHRRPVEESGFEALIAARLRVLAGDPDAPPIDVARATQGGLAVLAARVLGAGPLSGLAESSGTAYGLYLARRDGRRIDLGETLATARRDAQGLPAAAFPAALPAALARSRSPRPSEIEKRLRLTFAALTGRI